MPYDDKKYRKVRRNGYIVYEPIEPETTPEPFQSTPKPLQNTQNQRVQVKGIPEKRNTPDHVTPSIGELIVGQTMTNMKNAQPMTPAERIAARDGNLAELKANREKNSPAGLKKERDNANIIYNAGIGERAGAFLQGATQNLPFGVGRVAREYLPENEYLTAVQESGPTGLQLATDISTGTAGLLPLLITNPASVLGNIALGAASETGNVAAEMALGDNVGWGEAAARVGSEGALFGLYGKLGGAKLFKNPKFLGKLGEFTAQVSGMSGVGLLSQTVNSTIRKVETENKPFEEAFYEAVSESTDPKNVLTTLGQFALIHGVGKANQPKENPLGEPLPLNLESIDKTVLESMSPKFRDRKLERVETEQKPELEVVPKKEKPVQAEQEPINTVSSEPHIRVKSNQLGKKLDEAVSKGERFDEREIAKLAAESNSPEEVARLEDLYVKAVEHNQKIAQPETPPKTPGTKTPDKITTPADAIKSEQPRVETGKTPLEQTQAESVKPDYSAREKFVAENPKEAEKQAMDLVKQGKSGKFLLEAMGMDSDKKENYDFAIAVEKKYREQTEKANKKLAESDPMLSAMMEKKVEGEGKNFKEQKEQRKKDLTGKAIDITNQLNDTFNRVTPAVARKLEAELDGIVNELKNLGVKAKRDYEKKQWKTANGGTMTDLKYRLFIDDVPMNKRKAGLVEKTEKTKIDDVEIDAEAKVPLKNMDKDSADLLQFIIDKVVDENDLPSGYGISALEKGRKAIKAGKEDTPEAILVKQAALKISKEGKHLKVPGGEVPVSVDEMRQRMTEEKELESLRAKAGVKEEDLALVDDDLPFSRNTGKGKADAEFTAKSVEIIQEKFPDVEFVTDKEQVKKAMQDYAVPDDVLAFVDKDNKIYLTDKVQKDSPFHEVFGHVFFTETKKSNPELYGKIKTTMEDVLLNDKSLADRLKKDYPELYNDYLNGNKDGLLDEVWANVIGKKAVDYADWKNMPPGLKRIYRAVSQIVKEYMDSMRLWTAKKLRSRYTDEEFRQLTINDFVNKSARDLFKGKPIRTAGGETRFQIGGESSLKNLPEEERKVRTDNLNVADEMLKAGKDAKTIWMATGWEKGADGKWRYEIPDIKQKSTEERIANAEKLHKGGTIDLVNFVDAKELFGAYPALRWVQIKFDKTLQSNGSYNKLKGDGGFGQIRINPDNHINTKDLLSTLSHEIQHAIQEIEGFAKGGSPEAMKAQFGKTNRKLEIYQKRLNKALAEGDKEYADRLKQKIETLEQKKGLTGMKPGNTGYEAYTKLSGETESRNVEKRLGMTAEEKRNTPLSETEDVPRDKQIVRFQKPDTAGAKPGDEARARRLWGQKGTDSPYFKRWFGKSKVVDRQGKPLVVYHGTRTDFNEFETGNDGGIHFGTKEQALDRGSKLMPSFLKIENPMLTNDKRDGQKRTIEEAKRLGHDGLIYKNIFEGQGGFTYVVFSPEQIKSATGNRGTFDEGNPDIRFQKEDKEIHELAVKRFGTTTDTREAGYILPDGRMLDFSGKKQGGDKGERIIDHRQIKDIDPGNVDEDSFKSTGAIRYMPESDIFDIAKPLSKEQKDIIAKIVRDKNGYVIVEAKNGEESFAREYDKGTSARKVLSDIDKFYEQGKSKSKVQNFRDTPGLVDPESGKPRYHIEDKPSTKLQRLELYAQQLEANGSKTALRELERVNRQIYREKNKIGKVPMGEKESTTKGYNPKTMNQSVADKLIEGTETYREIFDNYRNRQVTNEQTLREGMEFARTLTDDQVMQLEPGTVANASEATGYRIYAEERAISAFEKVGQKPSPENLLEARKVLLMYMKTRALGTEGGRTVQSFAIKMDDNVINAFRGLQKIFAEQDPISAREFDGLIEEAKLKMSVREAQAVENAVKEIEKLKQELEKQYEVSEADKKKIAEYEDTIKQLKKAMKDQVPEPKTVKKALKKAKEVVKEEQDKKDIDNIIDANNLRPPVMDKISHWFYNIILSNPLTDMRNLTGNGSNLLAELVPMMISNPAQAPDILKGMVKGSKIGFQKAKGVLSGEVTGEDSKFTDNKSKRYDPNWHKWNFLLATKRLAAEDTFFREIAKGMYMGKEGKRTAKKLGIDLAQVEQRVNDLLTDEKARKDIFKKSTDKTDIDLADLAESMERFSKYLTFQSELGRTGKFAQKVVSSSLVVKFFIPFVKTPINIIKAGFNYSPAGFARLFGERGRKLTIREKQDVVRRAIAGSLVYSTLGALIANGDLEVTGEGPKDKDMRDLWVRMGYKPNMIYFMGKGVNYETINPFNIVLSLIGNWADQSKFDKNFSDDEKSFSEKSSKALAGMAMNFTEQSYLSGLSGLFKWMQYGDEEYLERLALQPVPNIARLPKQMLGDGKSFEANTFTERLERTYSPNPDLIPKYDVFGEQKSSTYQRFPWPVSTIRQDKELEKYLVENKMNVTYPGKGTKIKDRKTKESREMTTEEFAEYVRISGEKIKERLQKKLKYLQRKTADQAQDEIDDIVKDVRREVKIQLYKQQGR